MKELKVSADRNNLPKVQAFIDEQLEAADCPMATQIAIDVAVEELFINIASYAYGGKAGTAAVQVTIHRDPLSAEITFIDSGKQYDPLAKPDPDVTLPARERKKGGLGIFMVKNSMDDLKYAYKDGQNVLTINQNTQGAFVSNGEIQFDDSMQIAFMDISRKTVYEIAENLRKTYDVTIMIQEAVVKVSYL